MGDDQPGEVRHRERINPPFLRRKRFGVSFRGFAREDCISEVHPVRMKKLDVGEKISEVMRRRPDEPFSRLRSEMKHPLRLPEVSRLCKSRQDELQGSRGNVQLCRQLLARERAPFERVKYAGTDPEDKRPAEEHGG